MEETPDAVAEATDADFAREIHDAAEHDQFPRDRATRFYDRIRNTIQRYIDNKGAVIGKTAGFLTSSFSCGASPPTRASTAKTKSFSAAPSRIT